MRRRGAKYARDPERSISDAGRQNQQRLAVVLAVTRARVVGAGGGSMEKRLLQLAVAVAGLVPVGAGLAGALLGPAMQGQIGDAALNSHYRYLSGLLLGVGLLFWSTIPNIERQGARFGTLTTIVVIGGFCRALGTLIAGPPGLIMSLALVMELVVTPGLYLWRQRVGRLAAVDDGPAGR
jgi:hypothetical protein